MSIYIYKIYIIYRYIDIYRYIYRTKTVLDAAGKFILFVNRLVFCSCLNCTTRLTFSIIII